MLLAKRCRLTIRRAGRLMVSESGGARKTLAPYVEATHGLDSAMSLAKLTNLRIVLVRPQYSGNVGAVARAMRNFGLSDLALVNPAPLCREQAEMMAVQARDLLDTMQIYPSLRVATADCGLVVGTTCRPGLYRGSAYLPRVLAPRIAAAAMVNRVALVFGPEAHGLTNNDIRLCHQLVTIPTDEGYPSLNVAQAVLLCCYEVFLAACMGDRIPLPQFAIAERQELMYEKLKRALLKIGFLHRENPEHIMFAFRRIFGRAGLEERDVRILLGLARQIEWYTAGGCQVPERSSQAGK